MRMTGAEIAECLGMAISTVSGILARIGMGRLDRLGLEPAQHYGQARPGELVQIDVKKLGAGSSAGLENGSLYRSAVHAIACRALA